MKIAKLALALSFLLLSTVAVAQDTTSSGKSKSEYRTVTGCLTQGSSADKFVLNANDGSTWDLKSDQVALANRIGQTITVKGKVENSSLHNMKEETKDAASSAHMTKTNDEHGTLDVDSIKMVSKSCKQ
ncbi:MAG TPA: hypothetical protein VMH31_06620 [Methylomirabilota bacterium]|nr:hypothetical protein [Methylomirabilota bacterium]